MINTQISPDVAALVEVLTACLPGGKVTYDQLDAAIGRSVRQHYWLVVRARDVAARDYGAVFGSERGVGLVRLTADEAHTVGSTARARIKRGARKAGKVIRYALSRQNNVSPEATRKANAELSVLSLLEHLARDKSAKPTEAHDTRPEPVAIVGRRLLEAS